MKGTQFSGSDGCLRQRCHDKYRSEGRWREEVTLLRPSRRILTAKVEDIIDYEFMYRCRCEQRVCLCILAKHEFRTSGGYATRKSNRRAIAGVGAC
jgi:hypothetical protein